MLDVDLFLRLPPEAADQFIQELSPGERVLLDRWLDDRQAEIQGQRQQRWIDDPVGYVRTVLNETLWSEQRAVLESIRDNERTVVVAAHSIGKSFVAARAAGWWIDTNPLGTAQVITTAPTFRQVRHVLWPYIRQVHRHGHLPGEVLTTMWKVDEEVVAFGFSSREHDEAAVQGIHAPNLLVIVDEAGGISETLGLALDSLMSGGRVRMLLIGNAPTDETDTWFQRAYESPRYHPIRIAAESTPAFTGEDAPRCAACPPVVPAHPVTDHLISAKWCDEVTEEYGEDSAFVVARVHARFPDVITNRVIPIGWIDEAAANPDPLASRRVTLGVDVASGGGDEFAIARADGNIVRIVHADASQANVNAVHVAGVVLREIQAAEEWRAANLDKTAPPVRVKVEVDGPGWGVASTLEAWGSEGLHGAEIVRVMVGSRPDSPDRFLNRRAEMWWNGRDLLRPPTESEDRRTPVVKLDVDVRCQAQLSGPKYTTTSSGLIQIESKDSMRKRGLKSPDRADAVLLALYEPREVAEPAAVAPPEGLEGPSQWKP